jgi:hypothetical protein
VAATWALPIVQAWQTNANLVMLFGYTHAGYLMAKTIPTSDGVDDDGDHHTVSRSADTESNSMASDLARCMDESG